MVDSGFGDLTDSVQSTVRDTMGEDIEYEPLAGGSYSLMGVFNEKYVTVDPDTEQAISTNQPTVGIKLVDMTLPPVKGDFVTIRSVKYRVRDSQEDGDGWTVLFLYKT